MRKLIHKLTAEIEKSEAKIKHIIDGLNPPLPTISVISYKRGTMIAEIGDFNRFDSPDKILIFIKMSAFTDQSGELEHCHSHMAKCGFRYL